MLPTSFEIHGNGRRVRVARCGSGPPLVLLHGYPDNLQIWCELAPQLAARFSVIAFDWPGMGESDEWKGGASPTHMAARLVELLDAWGLKHVDLVGLDMGGQPALVAAALWPDRVRRLCVMNSLAFGDEQTSWEIRILRQYGWNRLMLRHLPALVFVRARWTCLPRGVRLSAELRREFWRSFRRAAVRRYIARMCAAYQGSLRRLPEHVARISCPTLVLWGERDRHFPTAHATRLQSAIPKATLTIVRGAEHWMAWYLAEPVGRAIVEFADAHA